MAYQFLAEMTFRTHKNIIHIMDDKFYCFKYTNERCDIMSFTNQKECVEWIITPFPSLIYHVEIE